MSALTAWLAPPPADAAVEIAPDSVSLAALSGRGSAPSVRAYAIEPIPAGVVTASIAGTNVLDRRAVTAALRGACDRLGMRPRRVALLLPDLAVRVSIVRFDRVPGRADDLEQLVRWQVRKSAPFPIEEGVLALTPVGRVSAGGPGEFIASLARRAVVREYETLCEELGMEPGLVDLSTFGVINLLLASPSVPAGDWLVVHVRPDYGSVAIMRGADMIFFRTVPGGDADVLADAVHQTAMFYQDRLSGQGFTQVVFGGLGRAAGSLDAARRVLEERLGTGVRPIDATRAAAFTDRITAEPERAALLAPLVGTLLRMRARAAA
jgi:type IV pilus assembly protein PilM